MSTMEPSAVQWRRSTRSGHQGGECVEVAFLTRIAVQDTPAANARA